MTNTQDQYKNWYKSMWKIYNSEWDKFLREYVDSRKIRLSRLSM